ncbi:MAG: hypothetical protein QM811_23890 [Pirellulales bacterium]
MTLAGGSVVNTSPGIAATISTIVAGTGFSTGGSGTLTLGGANTFTGQLLIGSGTTVKANVAGALGASGAGNETVVQSGGTFDVNGQALTTTEVVNIAGVGVGGLGALVNTGACAIERV